MDREVVARSDAHTSQKLRRSPLRIALGYVVFAVLWILASDWALFTFVPDPAHQTIFSQLKSAGFVAVTGLFLYLLLRAGDVAGSSAVPDAADRRVNRPVTPRLVLGAFIGLSATILITSYFVTSQIARFIRENEIGVLTAVSNLKVSEIEKWLEERWSDASVFSVDYQFGDRVRRWLDLGDNTDRERIVARLKAVQTNIDYESILLYDVRGRLRLEIGTAQGTNPNLERLVREVAKTRVSRLSDLYRVDARSDKVVLDFIAPLVFGDRDRPSIAGVMVLRVDPTHYLYNLIQYWPLPSRSGETLLVRRDGDAVLYLNELRHRPVSALTLRMPLTALRVPAVQAVHGMSGAFEGDDYRGIPVFSFLRQVRGTPWYFVAKVDRDEVLAPTRNAHLVSATITFVAIVLAGLVVGLGWRQQLRNFALRQRMQEAEKQALVKHFEYLSRNANDLILLADENLHIAEINDRAHDLIGYTREEMIGTPLIQYRSKLARETAAGDYARFRSEGRARYETTLNHRNGSELPIEVSAARVEVDGRYYYQLVVRDISERKRHEALLTKARDFHIRILDIFPNPVWRTGTDAKRDYFNQAWLKFTGRALEQELGDGWLEGVHPDDRQRCVELYLMALHAREPFLMEYRLHHRGDEYRWIADHGKPLDDADGVFIGYIGSCYDIHESRKHEERLRTLANQLVEQKNRLESVLAATPAHVYLHDREGRYLVVNDAALEALGMDRERMIGHTWWELGMLESVMQPFHEQRARVLQDKTFAKGQIEYPTVHGLRAYLYTISPVVGDDGSVTATVTTVTDITERKQAEEERDAAEGRYLRQRNALIALSASQALSTDDVAAAFRWITEVDAKTLGVARVSIWRYNRERTAIQCVDLYEREADRHSTGVELSAAAYPAYFRALLEKDVIAADDAHRDPRTGELSESYLRPLGITSMMDAHIQLGGAVDGILCHEHVGPPRRWTTDEKTFAVAVTNLVSLALEGWERKRNQEKLATAAEQFQGLVEQSIAGIFIVVDGRYVYVNPRLSEILGYRPADLIGHDAVETIVENDRPIFRANLALCLSGEAESQLISYLCRRPDGSTVDVGSHMNRATHAGRPAVIGVVQDISDKKRAEAEIQDYILQLERGMLSTIRAVSMMSELRDPYTYGHEQRVGDLSGAIAAEMGLDAHAMKGLQIAGYVHDIGKIVVPAEILAKPTKLTKAEFELIKSHPEQGYEVLKDIDFPWPVAQVALQHHERLDGTGYPQGLKGDQIILEARILAVADVVEAMAAHRPYRPSLGIDAAIEEVRKYRGVKYDSAAVDACVRLFHERGYVLKAVL